MTERPAATFRGRLRERAASAPRRIAFPEPEDPRVAAAIVDLVRDGGVQPVLVGDPRAFAPVLRDAGLGTTVRGEAEVLDPTRVADELAESLLAARGDRITADEARAVAVTPLMAAALALRTGRVDGVVAGAVHTTADVLRTAFHAIGPAEGITTVSSAFYMTVVPPGSDEEVTLTFTDCAVVPEPTAEQLAEIAESAVRARRAIVGDEPRVAFLSYATKGSAEGASVTRIREALARFRDRMPDVVADGELQGDAACVTALLAGGDS